MNLRDYERESIRAFVEKAGTLGYLKGRVLDYGAGRMPYRDLVESFGGDHWVYDSHTFPGSTVAEGFVGHDFDWYAETWQSILCTQVVQYVPLYPEEDGLDALLIRFRHALESDRGYLVMTYPTNWPEVEPEDLHRFTKAGMERLLTEAGFTIVLHERRGTLYDARFPSGREKRITALTDEFAIGYGVVARA